jgi:hypothetical protein
MALSNQTEQVRIEFRASVERLNNHAQVNWGAGYIEVHGEGVYPNTPNRAQARLMARRAAITDAQRNLLESVNGVRVTSETKVSNFVVTSDEIRTSVEGVIRNAVIVAEQDKGDNSYVVTMRVPFNGIAATFAQSVKTPESFGVSEENVRAWDPPRAKVYMPAKSPDAGAVSVPTNPSQPYTGVIIDARGLGLRPCMSPKIRREDGSEVWGTLNVSPDVVLEYGVAAWLKNTRDLDHPLIKKRLGDNPMFIRAVGAAGSGRGDAVVKADDARRLMEENQRGGNFLDRLAVVFLY